MSFFFTSDSQEFGLIRQMHKDNLRAMSIDFMLVREASVTKTEARQ